MVSYNPGKPIRFTSLHIVQVSLVLTTLLCQRMCILPAVFDGEHTANTSQHQQQVKTAVLEQI